MTIRTIIEAPDPRLKQVSARVETFDDELKALVADMFETMYDAPGIGLAAVQVGVPLRVVVIDLQERDVEEVAGGAGDDAAEEAGTAGGCEDEACGHDHDHGHGVHHGSQQGPARKDPRVFINPELSDLSEAISVYQEGCLSVPEIYADVERPARVRLRWQDIDGKPHEEEVEGLFATCIQHELDHLEGVLFIDHLSRLKRNMALKKLEKARKAA